jgi:hypothetical protein
MLEHPMVRCSTATAPSKRYELAFSTVRWHDAIAGTRGARLLCTIKRYEQRGTA